MDLQSKLLDASQRVLLYGTTPPRAGTPPDQIDAAADKLAARLAGADGSQSAADVVLPDLTGFPGWLRANADRLSAGAGRSGPR